MACITKRRDRWVIDFYDQFGKRHCKTLKKGTIKQAAKDELRAIEDQVANRTFLPANKVPTFSKLSQDWLKHKKPYIRITTWEVIEGHVRNHFKELEQYKINRITTATIEEFITTRQKQGMNINTLRKILVTLGQIFIYAVRHRYISFNPLREAERPRGRVKEGDPGKEKMSVLSSGQMKRLLDEAKEQKYKIMFMVAIFCGLRQGELIGLKWQDIDWENNQIHVQRTFTKGRFFDVKTKTSNRRVDLGPAVIKELKKWKLACPKYNLDLVFPSGSGKPINCSNMVRRHFLPALEAAALPRIRFHDLRHGYASLLIEQGENIKYIQSQLGHSSPTVTLNVYTHLMKPTNQEAARKLENSVLGG
ncbi:MAG: site-specific integrase [Deltaproteobacteria bacterium]|nr:site-specific integrase [Deltaproteobacteria bacterium]